MDHDSDDPAWTSWVGESGAYLFQIGGDPRSGREMYVTFDTNGYLRVFVRHTNVNDTKQPVSGINYNQTKFNKDVWYHIAYVQNGEDVTVYSNGIISVSFNISDTLLQGYRDLVQYPLNFMYLDGIETSMEIYNINPV